MEHALPQGRVRAWHPPGARSINSRVTEHAGGYARSSAAKRVAGGPLLSDGGTTAVAVEVVPNQLGSAVVVVDEATEVVLDERVVGVDVVTLRTVVD